MERRFCFNSSHCGDELVSQRHARIQHAIANARAIRRHGACKIQLHALRIDRKTRSASTRSRDENVGGLTEVKGWVDACVDAHRAQERCQRRDRHCAEIDIRDDFREVELHTATCVDAFSRAELYCKRRRRASFHCTFAASINRNRTLSIFRHTHTQGCLLDNAARRDESSILQLKCTLERALEEIDSTTRGSDEHRIALERACTRSVSCSTLLRTRLRREINVRLRAIKRDVTREDRDRARAAICVPIADGEIDECELQFACAEEWRIWRGNGCTRARRCRG